MINEGAYNTINSTTTNITVNSAILISVSTIK